MALSAELGLMDARCVHEETEGHEADSAECNEHHELGNSMKAFLVMIEFLLVLLDVLKELDRVLG